jgi:hypothetical protein
MQTLDLHALLPAVSLLFYSEKPFLNKELEWHMFYCRTGTTVPKDDAKLQMIISSSPFTTELWIFQSLLPLFRFSVRGIRESIFLSLQSMSCNMTHVWLPRETPFFLTFRCSSSCVILFWISCILTREAICRLSLLHDNHFSISLLVSPLSSVQYYGRYEMNVTQEL